LHDLFLAADIFIDLTPEGKYYKDKPVKVWNLEAKYIKMLYEEKHNFKLKFVVYAEINSTLQLYRLLDPIIQKRAKQMRILKKSKLADKIEKKRERSEVQKAPD
jgi:hypothetical protein